MKALLIGLAVLAFAGVARADSDGMAESPYVAPEAVVMVPLQRASNEDVAPMRADLDGAEAALGPFLAAHGAELKNRTAWEAAVRKMIAITEQLYTHKLERAQRALICDAVSERADLVTEMRQEQSNPSGFVDKVLLHELGYGIQVRDRQIAAAKVEYRKMTHKAFDGVCK